jgi:hypothetical protein
VAPEAGFQKTVGVVVETDVPGALPLPGDTIVGGKGWAPSPAVAIKPRNRRVATVLALKGISIQRLPVAPQCRVDGEIEIIQL